MEKNTLLLILGIGLIIGVYIVFITWWSLRKREIFAKELDAYLGDENNPECFKRILFITFENSAMSFVFVRFIVLKLKNKLFRKSKPAGDDFRDEVIDDLSSEVTKGQDECTKEQLCEFNKLFFSCLSLYVVRSPVSSFFVFLLVLIWALIKLLCSGFKFNAVQTSLTELSRSLKAH